jgi:hypothetical protein
MYRDSLAARDVADDRIGWSRIAAFGDPGHQVVHAADGDVCCGVSCVAGLTKNICPGVRPKSFWPGTRKTFGLRGLTHLLNPELVHSEKCVRVFVLKNLPLAKVCGGTIIRET